jgi:hypothetical protein
MVPTLAVAAIVAVPLPQTVPGKVYVIRGIGYTLAITAVLALVIQPSDEMAPA